MRRIAAPWGLSEEGKLKRNILIQVDENETLTSVEFDVCNLDSISSLEYYNGILIPAMVNAHCHLELSHLKGKISANGNSGLIDFFRGVSSFRNSGDNIQAMKLQDVLMWNEGVSAVGDISNSPLSFSLKSESKIRYRTFVEYYGFTDSAYEKASETLLRAKVLSIDASLSPHSTYLVSDELFRKTEHNNMVSIHFMESRTETGYFDSKGEMYDFVSSSYGKYFTMPPYKSAADRIIRCFDSKTRILLVHCTNMSRKDVEMLESHFNDITFVMCPCSNLYIENSVPPAKMLYEMGCAVAIGTDSLSSNSSLSLAKEISALCSYGVPLDAVLTWATRRGAEALGYSNDMGVFRKGRKSGAALVEGVNLNNFSVNNNLRIKRIV